MKLVPATTWIDELKTYKFEKVTETMYTLSTSDLTGLYMGNFTYSSSPIQDCWYTNTPQQDLSIYNKETLMEKKPETIHIGGTLRKEFKGELKELLSPFSTTDSNANPDFIAKHPGYILIVEGSTEDMEKIIDFCRLHHLAVKRFNRKTGVSLYYEPGLDTDRTYIHQSGKPVIPIDMLINAPSLSEVKSIVANYESKLQILVPEFKYSK